MIFGINATRDISKLSQISLASRLVKLRITISKYHPWYLCQISLKKNKSCYYLYKYWPIFRMKQSLSFCIVVLMIWIGNTVNHLWNKHKHCSQRKIEGALLFSSVIHGSAELFARGKNWNGVIVARFVFLFLARATFRETSKKMDIKNCQFYCQKKQTQTKREQLFIEMTSKCSKPCSETSRHGWWLH